VTRLLSSDVAEKKKGGRGRDASAAATQEAAAKSMVIVPHSPTIGTVLSSLRSVV